MTTPQEMTLFNEIAVLTMKVARPLIWHDVAEPWPKRLPGGTCFILRFDTGLIGVTAEHVIKAFEDAKGRAGEIVSLLRTVRFDLAGAIIDRDAELDFATFSITEEQLTESEATAIDCREEWPPPVPDKARELSVAGFPEGLKKKCPLERVEFRALVNLTRVEDITDRNIIATYEPRRDIRVLAAPELPDLGANWSGCSGGPVLMHVQRNGRHRWFPAGMIVEGPGKSPDGALQEFDRFLFRRVHFLNADGSITKSGVGWLPHIRR